jgi:RNA polymerase sigma factor (sigma-70 family)
MQKYIFETYSQEELIKGLKTNDPKVVRSLYQSQYKKVEHFVLNNNGTTDDAKDLYQDAFLVLWNHVKGDQFSPENATAVGGFLYRVARNKWLDRLRGQKQRPVYEMNGELPDLPDEGGENLEGYYQWIAQAFQNMGGNCKEVLRRFYYNKERMEEIAEALQWTPATARNNKYRCIQQLKEMWYNKMKGGH